MIERDHASFREVVDTADEPDPALRAFLDLLQRDIAEHPERLRPITRELAERMRRLSASVELDSDERIEGEVAL